MKCKCKEDKGYTTIACCNECGLPLKTEPWEFKVDTLLTLKKLYAVDYAEIVYEGIKNIGVGNIKLCLTTEKILELKNALGNCLNLINASK